MDLVLFRLVIILYMALFIQRLSTYTLCDFADVCGDIIGKCVTTQNGNYFAHVTY